MRVTHFVGELEPKRRDLPPEPTGRKPNEKVPNMWSPTGKARGTSPNPPSGGILSKGPRLKAVDRVEGSKIMSHDIRGSLVSMSSTLKLLSRGYYGKMDDGVATALEELLSKTTALTRMIEEYLGRTSPKNDGSDAERETMDLVQDVITPVMEEFSSELKDHPVEIDNSLAQASNRRISIKAGGIWLRAVLRNLLRNAITYGERRCKIILGFEDRGSTWRLNVYNSGKPVSEERRDRLFSRKSTRTGRRNTKGLGLGLYLIKRLIRKQGGDIWYEASQGGSRFVLTLPRG